MRLLPRRRPLPADVRDALDLVPGERVLASARTVAGPGPEGAAGGYAVATDLALYLPAAGGGHDRIGWERIARARLRSGVLVVSASGEPGTAPPVYEVALDQPGRLADAVHDRVVSTIVVSQHVPLEGRAGVRLVARRPPASAGEPGDLVWSMSFDRGLDPSDPAVVDRAAAALADVRRQMGV